MTKLYQFLLIHLLSKLLLVASRLQLVLSSVFINSLYLKAFLNMFLIRALLFSDMKIILM